MLTFIRNFDWLTFSISLTVFLVLSSLWNYYKALRSRNRALARAREADARLKDLLAQLKTKDQEIGGLIDKIKKSQGLS